MRFNFVLVAIVLAAMQQRYVVHAYTMNQTCTYYQEGFVGDPENCQGYGYCENNKLLGKATCPSGTSYDVYEASCITSSKVVCKLSLEDKCKNVVGPVNLGDPDDCQKYCYCENSKIVGCASCPKGQIFAEDRCIWQPEGEACGAQSICRLVPNYQIVGNPDNCGTYVVCLDGVGITQSCASGLYYNYNTGKCQSSNPCSGTTTTAPTDASTACTGQTVTGDPIFISDGATCGGYYACTSTSGNAGTFAQCPFGTHFDPTESLCVTPYTYNCPYDRCGNLNSQFVTYTKVSECKSFQYCENSASSGDPGKCPSSYPYFNEFTGVCQIAEPSDANGVYPICAAS